MLAAFQGQCKFGTQVLRMNDNGNDVVSPDPALYCILIEPTYVGILGHSSRRAPCADLGGRPT